MLQLFNIYFNRNQKLCFVISDSTRTRDRFSGTYVDWNTKGYHDIYYSEPSRDTDCAANERCSKSPHYAGKCLSIFYDRHFICTSQML
jgi:hypothetical protein